MNITDIFSFLVHPAKGEDEQPEIGGAIIPHSGKLFQMLSELFARSDIECNIEICFRPTPEGKQENDCRDEIIALLQNPCIDLARIIASRLQAVTTHRSGLGLLFLLIGKNSDNRKLCISRFPADVGILALEDHATLRVEFLEKVFMRNAVAYKAVNYQGCSFDGDFWLGKAVDKQLNNPLALISNYWIRDFLLSDFLTTPAEGTRRLAMALRKTMDTTENLTVKQEIAASSQLVGNIDGVTISIDEFMKRFSLSSETQAAVREKIAYPALMSDLFQFSRDEFERQLPYKSVELSSGAVMTARITDFDKCFEAKRIAESDDEFEFRAAGRIVNERLRKSK